MTAWGISWQGSDWKSKTVCGKINHVTDWRNLYEATALETDPTRLERLITETLNAILERLPELDASSNSVEERREIEEASAALRTLRIEKLGWPRTGEQSPKTD